MTESHPVRPKALSPARVLDWSSQRAQVCWRLCIFGAALLLSHPFASAQTIQSSTAAVTEGLEEIVVTATRRESTVQKTAGSITAVDAEEIQQRGLINFSDLAATVPGVSSTTSGPGQTEFELRGVSSPGGNSPTVGFYLDDTPLTTAAHSNSGKVVIDPALYDINRVEVLRGPQGTLYGSGSMGGTIRLITNQPDPKGYAASTDANLSGTDGGGFNQVVSGMINVPIATNLAALRVAATEETTSGWIDRIVLAPGTFPNPIGNARGDVAAAPVAEDYKRVNHAQQDSVRVSLLIQPIDNLSLTPMILYQHVLQGGPSAFDTDPGTLAFYQPFDVSEPYNENIWLGSLNVKYRLPGVDFASNTADFVRRQELWQDSTEVIQVLAGFPNAYSGGPIAFHAHDITRQVSQEFRVQSNGDSRFSWLGGLFYSNLESNGQNESFDAGLVPLFNNTELFYRTQPYSIRQEAVFGEISYDITNSFKATVGARRFHYNSEVTTFSAGVLGPSGTNDITTTRVSGAAGGLTPKYDLSYIPNDNLTLYATASKGFRPGGGNQPIITSGSPEGDACAASLAQFGLKSAPLQYFSDSLWSYEFGEKLRLFDKRLKINASVFEIDWKGIQQGTSLSCGYSFTLNAGEAKIDGGELEVEALLAPGLVFGESAGYMHARITEGSLAAGTTAGDPLQTVPKWTSNTNLTYTRPVGDNFSIVAHAEYNYIGPRANQAYESLTPTPAERIANLNFGLTRGNITAKLYANNVFDEHTIVSYLEDQAADIPEYNRAMSNQPRTVGVDISVRY